MNGAGQLTFGAWTGQTNGSTSQTSYNDGAWHHVVATQGPDGMKLYVDGQLVGTNPQTQAQAYNGYWRSVATTPGTASQPYFAGSIDEVGDLLAELTAAQVRAHYQRLAGCR